MKHLAEIGQCLITTLVVAMLFLWLGSHAQNPGHWFPVWCGRLALVSFILGGAATLSPVVAWIQERRATEDQARTDLQAKARTVQEQRRPLREQLRAKALYYEERFGWTTTLSPAERRFRAIELYDQVVAWPEEDRELYDLVANDDFEVVSHELGPLVRRLVEILDARKELYRIALLETDPPVRAAHQLRIGRAIQEFKVREAREAAALAKRLSSPDDAQEVRQMTDGACCPITELVRRES